MKKSKFTLTVLFFFIIFFSLHWLQAETQKEGKAKTRWPILRGSYLGQKPPGMIPEIFAPGILNTNKMGAFCSVFSSDNNEFYFVYYKKKDDSGDIFWMRRKNNVWTKPEKLPFNSTAFDNDMCMSADGNKLIFRSWRALPNGKKPKNHSYLWYATRTIQGWSRAKPLFCGGEPVRTGYPSISNNGTLYFAHRRNDRIGIYRSKYKNTAYDTPEFVFTVINNQMIHGDMFVAMDESFMIISCRDPEGKIGYGLLDLYIIFRRPDGSYSKAINMGPKINTKNGENCPQVSPDGQYFFFNRYNPEKKKGDIYWMDANIIKNLKPSDITSRDRMNRTPLHQGAAKGNFDQVAGLIKRGASPNTKDIYGSTPLHEAAFQGHYATVKLLLTSGAKPNARRPDGKTPLSIARERGNQKIADLLLKNGAIDKPMIFPELKGDYLGQSKPGKVGVLFAPGIISKAESRDLMHGFFEGGKLFFLYRYPNDFKGNWTQFPVFLMKQKGDKWIELSQSKLVGKPWFYNLEKAPAGERKIFAWTKNLDGSGPKRELYLWSSTKIPGGWSKPIRFKAPINSGFDTWPCLTSDKTLLFFSRRAGGIGKADLYMSIPEHGEYKRVKNLGKVINTKYVDEDPYIAPDGSYLLFDSDRPGGYGGYDIYVTYRKADGTWTKPINLGVNINSKYSEMRSYVSPDGKYLFYTSSRTGNLDAFWVDAKIIEKLKPKGLK